MNIAEKYLQGLKQAYYNAYKREIWDDRLSSVLPGASKEDIARLKEKFPDAPDALIYLLEYVDGAFGWYYNDADLLFFGSPGDDDTYPYRYYLWSTEGIFKSIEEYKKFVDEDYLEHAWKYWEVDSKIAKESKNALWLHFAQADNNDSRLFIDFTPSETGKKGQIIRHVRGWDELNVIADSFDDYLQMLMDRGYDFVWED